MTQSWLLKSNTEIHTKVLVHGSERGAHMNSRTWYMDFGKLLNLEHESLLPQMTSTVGISATEWASPNRMARDASVPATAAGCHDLKKRHVGIVSSVESMPRRTPLRDPTSLSLLHGAVAGRELLGCDVAGRRAACHLDVRQDGVGLAVDIRRRRSLAHTLNVSRGNGDASALMHTTDAGMEERLSSQPRLIGALLVEPLHRRLVGARPLTSGVLDNLLATEVQHLDDIRRKVIRCYNILKLINILELINILRLERKKDDLKSSMKSAVMLQYKIINDRGFAAHIQVLNIHNCYIFWRTHEAAVNMRHQVRRVDHFEILSPKKESLFEMHALSIHLQKDLLPPPVFERFRPLFVPRKENSILYPDTVILARDQKMPEAKDEGNAGDSKREATEDQLLNSVREGESDEFQDGVAGLVTEKAVEVKDEDEPVEEQKKGRGRKRKAKAKPKWIIGHFLWSDITLTFCCFSLWYINIVQKKAKTAVAAMLTRSREDRTADDSTLTEEERWEKEQANLVPLLTGGKLKSYQIKGIKWLISLWQNGLNGILADQMGLGKTIQTIGFLAHLKGNGMDGPYMVIAPLSTLSNWLNELSRFAPSLIGLIYHGDKVARAELRRKFMPKKVGPNFPIIITSFEMAMFDAKLLANYQWKYVVVDEGHRLKNTNCKLLRELRRIPMENKLLLTGTPLQNNLAELWSLLNFILPDIFSSHQEFESWFDFSGKGDGEQQEETDENKRVLVVSKLHAILRPFLLRRMKEDVEHMLPRKKEIIIYANMTEHQKQIQNHLVERTFDNYLHENTDIVLRRPGIKTKLNNLLIQLRKNCGHPDLLDAAFDTSYFYPPVEKLLEQCGKFQLLDRLLDALLKRNHKVLIFSQWTKVLDILDYYLDTKGLKVCRIDGNVKLEDRRKQKTVIREKLATTIHTALETCVRLSIDVAISLFVSLRQIAEFNDLNSGLNVFILSTRAGGLGINLTSADTCILYDSDWNPQMDLQAMDRCHRIGQTKPVHVYRLATSNSVEGRIIKRAFGKLKLEHVVIGKGQFQQDAAKPNALDEAELLALLRDEQGEEDRMIQMDISDEDLLKVMDRSDLTGPAAAASAAPLVPLKGPGWEVVLASKSGGGMLSALTS
ncbi:ATP-dependent DNA helicase DDM1 [Triticum urartu]|uniref:ATP-dependent DNA helicase DDM1 n=1 Tax=Triticum urartu TaxID=4572 RepID=M7YY26_TRIUA|nr:ATP-dependent DNA helicase DDM1 [Triticum urartu]